MSKCLLLYLVKNPPLSSVLAKKEAATKIVSSADVIFKEMQRIKWVTIFNTDTFY